MKNRPIFSDPKAVRENWPDFCHTLFEVAVQAARPENCLIPHMPDIQGFSSVTVLAVGKASVAMADVFLDACGVTLRERGVPLSGLVIAREGAIFSERLMRTFQCMVAAHPVPDERSVLAGKAALALAAKVPQSGLFLVLLSGGASALMCAPVAGLGLVQKQHIISTLLNAGASIHELNSVRRLLSEVKGGGLLHVAKSAGRVVTCAISDVVGDSPAVIGSGPTVPLRAEETVKALGVLKAFDIALPDDIHLSAKHQKGTAPPLLPPHDYRILASGKTALDAVRAYLEDRGFEVILLGADEEGEAAKIAQAHAAIILAYVEERSAQQQARPLAFLSGGELTVTVTGGGTGDPNRVYGAHMMGCLPDPAFHILAFDTDGMDGVGGPAGAFVDGRVREKAANLKHSRAAYLENSDVGSFFDVTGGHLVTGPSGTNVNDIRLVCWLP